MRQTGQESETNREERTARQTDTQGRGGEDGGGVVVVVQSDQGFTRRITLLTLQKGGAGQSTQAAALSPHTTLR